MLQAAYSHQVHPKYSLKECMGSWLHLLSLRGSDTSDLETKGLHCHEVSDAVRKQQDRQARSPLKLIVSPRPCQRKEKIQQLLQPDTQLGRRNFLVYFLQGVFCSVPDWQHDWRKQTVQNEKCLKPKKVLSLDHSAIDGGQDDNPPKSKQWPCLNLPLGAHLAATAMHPPHQGLKIGITRDSCDLKEKYPGGMAEVLDDLKCLKGESFSPSDGEQDHQATEPLSLEEKCTPQVKGAGRESSRPTELSS